MQVFIEESQAQIAELCRAYHVRRLALFGSAARDDFDPGRSDIDLMVEFEPNSAQNRFESYFRLHAALEQVLRRKVDLIEAGSVKSPYIQRTVERDQRALYAA
jgi:predicted nucleotidyltransferase